MMSDPCTTVRDMLARLDNGELSNTEHREIDAHADQCADCAAVIWIRSAATAAGADPEPISELGKRRILNGVHRANDARSSRFLWAEALLRWRWAGVAIPAVAVVVATLVVFLRASTFTGWVTTPTPELRVFAEQALLESEGAAEEPRLVLRRGAIFAELNRKPAVGPMRVVTPHATVIVRGTVYFVRVTVRDTVVGVRRGSVEVAAGVGESVDVGAGEQVRVGPTGLRREPIEAGALERLNRYLPVRKRRKIEPTVAENSVEPAMQPLEPATAAAQPTAKRPERRAGSPARIAAKSIARARAMMRDGQYEQAIELLTEVAASAPPAERIEALYLMATIYRRQGNVLQAIRILEEISTDATTSAGRLALLERARLVKRHLGDRNKARRILEQLLATPADDAVAELGRFELCALLLEQRELDQAERCLSTFVNLFPESARRGDADRLRHKLELLRIGEAR